MTQRNVFEKANKSFECQVFVMYSNITETGLFELFFPGIKSQLFLVLTIMKYSRLPA